MNLLALQNEVFAHGFDPVAFTGRVTQYLNDAQNLIARRVDYYTDQATQTISTGVGVDTYAWPTDFARAQSVFDAGNQLELQYVSLRQIDASSLTQGRPYFYAIAGPNLRFYPVPDGVYTIDLRYWKMPAQLVNSTDIPSLPADWTHLLWVYATWMCYEAEDDPTMGQYWQQRFSTELSMFGADQKFPSADGPTQAQGMWSSDDSLSPANSWALYGAGW